MTEMLEEMIMWVLHDIAGMNEGSRIADMLGFFLYDTIKIMFLLFLMIGIMGFLRTYIPEEKVRAWLSKARFGAGNFAASLFGAATPFCSCSSIPIFLSFLKAGVPLGITFSFLITSPIVNEYLVVLMFGFFGWKITTLYVLFGVLIGTVSGLVLGKMGLERHIEKDISGSSSQKKSRHFKGIRMRLQFGLEESLSIIKKLWLWILLGVAMGAAIHNLVPETFIRSVMSRAGFFAVPIAVALGIPMYGSCAAIVPIAVALFDKGVPLGTALSFMMAVSALSLPEAVILRRAMKLRLIMIFFGIVTAAIILSGYAFNLMQGFV